MVVAVVLLLFCFYAAFDNFVVKGMTLEARVELSQGKPYQAHEF